VWLPNPLFVFTFMQQGRVEFLPHLKQKGVPVNKLANQKSAYLQHAAHQKINWYPWGDEAFEKAKQEDKPVFLSSGAIWCHWCHVMAKESFEDPE
jgi:uncharacterized protein YyaL (SSP411 family)